MTIRLALTAIMLLSGMPANSNAAPSSPSTVSKPFEFTLSKTMLDGQPRLIVMTRNRSSVAQCVFSGLVDGTASNEMSVAVRAGNTPLRYRPWGYLPDPGKAQPIQPGGSFVTTFNLRTIFRGTDDRRLLKRQWSANVGFRFRPCDTDKWALVRSEWKPI